MEIALLDMSIVRHDWPRKSGRVAMYFRSELQCEPIENSVSTVQDSLWRRLSLKATTPAWWRSFTALLPPRPRWISIRVINTTYSRILITDDFNTRSGIPSSSRKTV
ncbi:unnamed protein product [Dicrocoelium dendriticum]|nr:unnamed protein product [Dicrocoelium dendriticum]